MFKKKRIYLDYAAATPLSKAAYKAMKPYLREKFANPSAIHRKGQIAKEAVEKAREKIARVIQVKSEYITFTSGGTEANNLAILGLVEHLVSQGANLNELEIITTRLEHPSVLKVMEKLSKWGVTIKYVKVNHEGLIDNNDLEQLLSEKTVLLSVAYANSEIGVVQNLHNIKKSLTAAENKFNTNIYFHLDAAQAPLWLNCQFDSLKADLVSFDVGKCNGPKGIGLLVRSRRAKIVSQLLGGGQEDDLRAGTENVPGIVGAAVAFLDAQSRYKTRAEKVTLIRDQGIEMLKNTIPSLILNGPMGEKRIANNINISIPGLDTEFATVVLDKHGYAVSTKSACSGAGGGESTVVKEISGDPDRANSTLRISLSPETSLRDIKGLSRVLKEHLNKMEESF